jgi:hypothetical protein
MCFTSSGYSGDANIALATLLQRRLTCPLGPEVAAGLFKTGSSAAPPRDMRAAGLFIAKGMVGIPTLA